MPFSSHQALTLKPLLRQAANRSLQTAIFCCRLSACKLFSITVTLVSDSILQSPRLYDTIRFDGDIFWQWAHSDNPPLALTVTKLGRRCPWYDNLFLTTPIRKSLIYKTGVEYGDYTAKHIFECPHGCKYPCYAYMMAKRFGKIKTYKEWLCPQIVENTLELLDRELPSFKEKIKLLHLCFSTDSFMYGYKEIENLSIEVLHRANNLGIRCLVLKKGVLPQPLADLPLQNEYGITLVSLNESFIQ